ncbi:MAG: MFS transporter [Planctomycetota bacterium]|nr:MFS transporter [Planctomycetota bacterium]
MEEQRETETSTSLQREKKGLLRFLLSIFSSLKHRNYRLFFCGQAISLIGTWMQMTAQGWLVYSLSRSKFVLGLVSALSTLPLALLSPVGGVVADRFSRRRILIFTQSLSIVPPLLLSLLVLTKAVQVWHIALLAALLGTVNAFDMPTRQSFVIEMVGREDLMNAIGLNSGLFNSARIIGPAIAGIVMAEVGIGYCFLLNGLSFIPVVIALLFMRILTASTKHKEKSSFTTIIAGFKYVKNNPRLFGLLGLLSIMCVFGFSYSSLLPAFARDILSVRERQYGELLTFNGIGAVTGALLVASFANKVKNRKHFLFIGASLFSVSLTIFSLSTRFPLARFPLIPAGIGMILFLSTANTLIQTTSSDEFRGRVMGIWTFAFGGSMPLGSFIAGTLAHYLGITVTLQMCALICMAATLTAALFSRNPKCSRAILPYEGRSLEE